MIDLAETQKWFDNRRVPISQKGLVLEVSYSEKSPKPVVIVQVRGANASGQFSVWSTGEADYDIYRDAAVVTHEWGIMLDNISLPSAFDRFIDRLSQQNASSRYGK